MALPSQKATNVLEHMGSGSGSESIYFISLKNLMIYSFLISFKVLLVLFNVLVQKGSGLGFIYFKSLFIFKFLIFFSASQSFEVLMG